MGSGAPDGFKAYRYARFQKDRYQYVCAGAPNGFKAYKYARLRKLLLVSDARLALAVAHGSMHYIGPKNRPWAPKLFKSRPEPPDPARRSKSLVRDKVQLDRDKIQVVQDKVQLVKVKVQNDVVRFQKKDHV